MKPGGDEDLGRPIEALAELRAPASEGFFGRVRGRIDRRRLTVHILDMTWSGIGAALLEFLEMIAGILGANRKNDGGPPTWTRKD